MNDTNTLTLVVRNHPGVLLQVASLITRRAFRMETLNFAPETEGRRARIQLQIRETVRLEQVIRQFEKLEDVIDVECACLTEVEESEAEEMMAV